jgi:tetratricopeptide (TPR) repeat protein
VGRLALAGMIAIPALAAVGYAGWKYYQSLPPDKIIILVADFDGPDKKKYRVTGNIIEQLREATKKYPDVQVKVLPETITYEKGSDYARTVGKNHKASIVLWGEYAVNPSMVQVNVNFEVLRSPSLLNLRQQKEALNVTVAELESFKTQAQLSQEMSYLVLLTVGLARYEANDYDSALDLFTDALKQEAIPEKMVEPAVIYFYRGNIYYYKGNSDQSIADFNKAIELKPDFAEAYNNRGNVYKLKGEKANAQTDFKKVLELTNDPILRQKARRQLQELGVE